MTTSILDAFDLLAHAEVLEQRLVATATEFAKCDGLAEEKSWLEAARRKVAEARKGSDALSLRILALPDLESARGERGRTLQGSAVDALEALHGAIVAVNDRSPLLEAIFRNLRIPQMRRAGRGEFERFCGEVEKRLGSSYVSRMLGDSTYEPVAPAVDKLRAAFEDWQSIFTAAPPDDVETRALRGELEAAAARLEQPCRQARLLAEAALLPAPGMLEASGILEKPKRRGARAAKADGSTTDAPPAVAPAPPTVEVAAREERSADNEAPDDEADDDR